MKNSIVLIGFMGSGKTTFGKILSERHHYQFMDTDDLIMKKENMPITEIFKTKGEDYFRQLETDVLKELTHKNDKMILSTGGGMILKQENVALMKSIGTVVYLKASPHTLANRLKNDTTRPLLKGKNKFLFIKDLLAKRKDYYEKGADVIIKTDEKNIQDILKEIEGYL
ncbi:shikimate kinase [Natranaerovirga hydrolytica]|uniref:Shikimate kinase n=1 Tax=Natranaerovirga hydrolytica TaxID=680378 RepID=A0A4R1N0I1_9FIRM|nr:shikimate kinase [Natranaerovirga hydrolytica]TCK98372.1 shikimate kinase [Natranaerovirga hydrolytica]